MAPLFNYPTFEYLYKGRTWSTGIMDEIILNKKTRH